MNLQVIKLVSGEEIVAEIVDFKQTSIVLKNPLLLMLQQSPDGKGFGNSILPWANSVEGLIEINLDKIIYQANPRSELLDNYGKIFGKVLTPKTPKILING